MYRSLLTLLLTVCALPAWADSYLTRQLNAPVPGGVAVVDLGNAPAMPQAFLGNKPVLVVKEQDTWRAVVGIALKTPAGPQALQVRQAGSQRSVSFTVGSKTYPEQRITLKNKRQVNPEPDDLVRINKELAEQNRAYASFSPGTPSNLLLDKPVNGPLSSRFGVRRFFNGEERNPHAGLDFAVPAGTPIKTPAAGKVILVGNYFFNGNTVFVDHGQGFISMFCHMSKIDVSNGQVLARGGRKSWQHWARHWATYALERQPERHPCGPRDFYRRAVNQG
jgi:murein DD-endopeptidase MepM/ murein hydrolase activator NlpD